MSDVAESQNGIDNTIWLREDGNMRVESAGTGVWFSHSEGDYVRTERFLLKREARELAHAILKEVGDE